MGKGSSSEGKNFLESLLGPAPSAIDPREAARRTTKRAFPKRFWREVAVAAEPSDFVLTLDGKVVRTPFRHKMAVPSRRLAEALAAEWRAIDTEIDPAKMPLTRLIYAAIDAVATAPLPVVAEIAKYARSDLLCYREADNERLAARQAARWDPVLVYMREAYGARFTLARGVVFTEQPRDTIEAVGQVISLVQAPFGLAALHAVTTLTGSAILALTLAAGRLSPDEVWAAAHVDEDFQIEAWGEDAEASVRRAARRAEFDAAALVLATLR